MGSQVYAFAKVTDLTAREKVYQEIKNGKARFGMWDQTKSLNEQWYGKNAILKRIKPKDWIVYVNMPSYGKCMAAEVVSEYDFDQGIDVEGNIDFNNFITINTESIIEFNRNDSNVLPSVNLEPKRRAQRILEVNDFLESLENLRNNNYSNENKSDHLKNKIEKLLPEITANIHKMNKSKDFERFLHKIFNKIPNVISIQNGFGWKSDNGADLIIEFENPIIGINVSSKIIVQAKSYQGNHIDLNAIDQIVTGIEKYNADAGLLITTGNITEALEDYALEKSEKIGKTIDIIAGNDVARFVLRYAPEMIL